ncbi:MAG: hypothetical protein ACLFQQ_01290 [Desulfococcaceae bacterium]
MDEDGIPENGIQISPSVHLAAQGRDVDFSLYGNTFGASPDVAALLAAAGENGAFSAGPGPRAPVSEESAAAHPAKTLPALTPSVPHPGSGDGRGGSGGSNGSGGSSGGDPGAEAAKFRRSGGTTSSGDEPCRRPTPNQIRETF